jgi:GGDEF domain-containing protein
MATIDRAQLERLERRGVQLTVLSAVFVLVLATGLATFMYPIVFVHPEGNKWTLRVAFFGFCALTILFVGYLLDRQRTFNQMKKQMLVDLERYVALKIQSSAELLASLPDQNQFWDRLTTEFRQALSTEKTMSLLLVKLKHEARASETEQKAAQSDAAKALAKKLRPTDQIYRLSEILFGVVLPGADSFNTKRIAARLQDGLEEVRTRYGSTFDLTTHNYPDNVKSCHELEEIVKSLLPEKEEWNVPAETVAG